MTNIIEINNLNKSFQIVVPREGVVGGIKDLVFRNHKTIEAVKNITFSVNKGELLGFIGPNGAGKSTTIKMLTGILKPTSGNISVLGVNPFKSRREFVKNIGVVFGQRTQLWWDIPVIESLKLLGKIYKVEDTDFKQRFDLLVHILNLNKILQTPVRKLSLGERIRSDLAAALLHNPKVLFLDEPTIGLDAIGKEEVRKFIREINHQYQVTVLLTTHDMNEIEELCKRIIIIDKGSLVFDGGIDKVKKIFAAKSLLHLELTKDISEDIINRTKAEMPFEITANNAKHLTVTFNPENMPLYLILNSLSQKLPISQMKIEDPSIEEIIRKIYQQGVIQSVV